LNHAQDRNRPILRDQQRASLCWSQCDHDLRTGDELYTGDLPHVTSSIVVTCGSTAGTIGVIMPDDPDGTVVTISIPANSRANSELVVAPPDGCAGPSTPGR
jgi:hypothetical protein